MPRGKYKKIDNIDRERIVSAFNEGRDWREVAEALNIERQTARNIIVNFRRSGTIHRKAQGGAHHRKIDQEMLEFVLQLIEEKSTITLQEMSDRLRAEMPAKPNITPQALSNRLEGEMYTLKDLRSIPYQWNTPERKAERMDDG